MQETYSRFSSVDSVDGPCAFIVLCNKPGAHSIRLCFSNIVGAASRDLVIRFDSVIACMSHTKYAHPWETYPITEIPQLGGDWGNAAYPLLEVKDSLWLDAFSATQSVGLDRDTVRHFRFVSLDNIVDVLVYGQCVLTTEWVDTSSSVAGT